MLTDSVTCFRGPSYLGMTIRKNPHQCHFVVRGEFKAVIVVRMFFLLLAIPTSMGAVSLGTFNTPNSSGSYLVDNPLFEFLGLFFAGLGGRFLFRAGRLG